MLNINYSSIFSVTCYVLFCTASAPTLYKIDNTSMLHSHNKVNGNFCIC